MLNTLAVLLVFIGFAVNANGQFKTSTLPLTTEQLRLITADDDVLLRTQAAYRAALTKAKNNISDPAVTSLRPAYVAAMSKRRDDVAKIIDGTKPYSSTCAPNQVSHSFKTAELDTSNGQMSILVREGERPCGLGANAAGSPGMPMARAKPLAEPAPRAAGTRTAPNQAAAPATATGPRFGPRGKRAPNVAAPKPAIAPAPKPDSKK